jgi:hypothetical protein
MQICRARRELADVIADDSARAHAEFAMPGRDPFDAHAAILLRRQRHQRDIFGIADDVAREDETVDDRIAIITLEGGTIRSEKCLDARGRLVRSHMPAPFRLRDLKQEPGVRTGGVHIRNVHGKQS